MSLDVVDENLAQAGGGSFNTQRYLTLFSPTRGALKTLFAGELYLSDGPFDRPQNYRRINVFAKATAALSEDMTFRLIGSYLYSDWFASGEIPGLRGPGREVLADAILHRAESDRVTAMSLLDGLRVIEAASFIVGPVATTMLADLGADVIKIEPPAGDPYRHRTGGPGVPESPYNYRWIVDNRTKRGLALDLQAPEGLAVLHRLVARADVFVSNTPLDSRRRLGIRWEDLAPLNGRLIYASVTVDKVAPRLAPELGEHSVEILREAGYGEAKIDTLLTTGVVAQAK